jgi:O-antigen ligase
MNIISLYLCKSIFSFVEVFVGIAVLLFIFKKYKDLFIWFSLAALTGFIIFILHIDLIPRLDDVDVTLGLRFKIWNLAFGQILKTPLLGHGFMTFLNVFNIYYDNKIIPHSHSLYLESLLNFGIIGTVLFSWYFFKYYLAVILAWRRNRETMITSLILAVTAAALVHGTTDITLFWIQTFPLFLIILSGFGGLEKPNYHYNSIHMK